MSLWRRIYGERRAWLLPIAVVLIANLGVFMLAVVPLRTSMAAAEAQEREAAADHANARRAAEQATAAANSRQQADVQLKQFYGSVLPQDFATARKTATLYLEQAAVDAGLLFRSSHFVPESMKDSRLSRAAGTLVLQGRYTDIRRFLHAVETAEEFIVIERVELAQAEATQPGSDAALGIEIAISTYFLTPAAR